MDYGSLDSIRNDLLSMSYTIDFILEEIRELKSQERVVDEIMQLVPAVAEV